VGSNVHVANTYREQLTAASDQPQPNPHDPDSSSPITLWGVNGRLVC
jgi:hypothetical protein